MNYEEYQIYLEKLSRQNLQNLEKEVIAIYQNMNDNIQSEILKIYKKYDLPKATPEETIAFMQSKITVADKGRITRLQAEQQEIGSIMNKALLKKDKLIEQYALDTYQNGYYWNAYATTNAVGVNLAYPLIDETMIKKAVYDNPFSVFQMTGSSKSALSKVNKMMWDRRLAIQRVTRELELAAGRGDSLQTLARKLDIIFGFRDPVTGKLFKATKEILNKKTGKMETVIGKRGETWKSLRVARTELHRLFETGKLDQFFESQELGVEAKLKYIATLDNRTRPQSAGMDGQVSDDEGKFEYPDGTRAWLSNSGRAEWDINDRCAQIQIIDGITPPLRRLRDKGVVEYTEFKDWAKEIGLTENIYGQSFEDI